jgi:hypothetical protein
VLAIALQTTTSCPHPTQPNGISFSPMGDPHSFFPHSLVIILHTRRSPFTDVLLKAQALFWIFFLFLFLFFEFPDQPSVWEARKFLRFSL